MRRKTPTTTFNLKCGYRVECRSERTRYGFRHLAEVIDTKGNVVSKAKVCYYNRTWESFTFETVMERALRSCKWFDKYAVNHIMNTLRDEAHGKVKAQFAFVGGIAKLGEIFGTTRKESNDWKARMLKAGMPGLIMPSDWDTLSEEEKTARLDAVIAHTKRHEQS